MNNKKITNLIFAAILFCGSAFAQESISEQYLVDKIYNYRNQLVTEYFYDDANRLIKRIFTDTIIESWRTIISDFTDEFVYENERVSKIKRYSRYRDSEAGYDYENNSETIIKYDAQGKPIWEDRNFTYKDGFLINTYEFEFGGLTYKDTVFYDDSMNNIIMQIFEYPETDWWGNRIEGTKWFDTVYFEYDNNPKPNFGIDELIFNPYPYSADKPEYQGMLSKNNMTDVIGGSYRWIYTYNEEGLPATLETQWVGIETLEPMLLRITYKKTSSIKETTKNHTVNISPNPVHQNAIIEVNSLEIQANTVITILDISGSEIVTVYSGLLPEGINTFPLPNNLSNGSYFVLVKNRNGQKIEQFIIAR